MKYDFEMSGFARELDGSEPSWLQNMRKEAAGTVTEMGLPHTKMEDWRYTNLKDFASINFQRAAHTDDTEAVKALMAGANMPDIDSYTVVTVNGRFDADLSDLDGLPAGVAIGSLREALLGGSDLAQKLFGTTMKTEAYYFQALNTANFDDGLFIHVEKDVELDKPLVHYVLTVNESGAAISFPRNLFIFEENSKAMLVEQFNSAGSYCLNPVTETFVRKHARVRRYGIYRDSHEGYFFGTGGTVQESESDYESINMQFAGLLFRDALFVNLDGDDIVSSVNAVYHQTGGRQTDNFTRVRHLGLRGESTQIYKGVLDDTGTGVFDGRIFVQEGAQKTDAVQTNRSLLLSDDAVSYAKPQLEIYADDVKCTHGATTGQLDETMLFYLRSRGFDQKSAKAELTYAFAAELIDEIELEPLREQLREELFTLLSARA